MACMNSSSRRCTTKRAAAAKRSSVARIRRRCLWKGSARGVTKRSFLSKLASHTSSTCSGSEDGEVLSDPSPSSEDVSTVVACSRMLPRESPLGPFHAVVINLDRRPDRMDAFAKSSAMHCPWLQYDRLPAADGKKEIFPTSEVGLSWHTETNCVYQRIRSIRKGWNDLDNYLPRELKLSAGERGCSMSHIRAWRHCLVLNEPLIVLEDDAALTPDFTPVLARALTALPTDAQLLYLGYSQAAPWRTEITAELVESEYVWTTVGYMIWPSGARLLLSQLPVNQPVDNWMASFSAANQLKAYAVRPKIVRQAEEWNVMSDVAHSDEALANTIEASGNTTAGRVYLSHDTHHHVDLWSQSGVNQQWCIGNAANGLHTIKTCVGTHSGRVYLSHDTHQNVDLWCDAGENQLWRITTVTAGVYTIQAAAITSGGKTYLRCDGNNGVKLFAEDGGFCWKIPDSAFEAQFAL